MSEKNEWKLVFSKLKFFRQSETAKYFFAALALCVRLVHFRSRLIM